MVMDFLLLVELEDILITFYHHTFKYHNIQDEKNNVRKDLSLF